MAYDHELMATIVRVIVIIVITWLIFIGELASNDSGRYIFKQRYLNYGTILDKNTSDLKQNASMFIKLKCYSDHEFDSVSKKAVFDRLLGNTSQKIHLKPLDTTTQINACPLHGVADELNNLQRNTEALQQDIQQTSRLFSELNQLLQQVRTHGEPEFGLDPTNTTLNESYSGHSSVQDVNGETIQQNGDDDADAIQLSRSTNVFDQEGSYSRGNEFHQRPPDAPAEIASPVQDLGAIPSVRNTVTSVSQFQSGNQSLVNSIQHATRIVNNDDNLTYPEFQSKDSRLSTYRHWPPSLQQNLQKMADAGFFHTGQGDHVRCFCCNIGLLKWEVTDDPWIEHARWSPRCAYIRNSQGQHFIDIVGSFTRLPNKLQAETSVRQQFPPLNIEDARRRQSEHMTIQHEQMTRREQITRQREHMTRQEREHRNPLLTPEAQSLINMGYTPRKVNIAINRLLQEYGWQALCKTHLLEILIDMEESDTRVTNQSSAEQNDSATTTRNILQENARLKELRNCKICLEKDVSILFLPCGHLCSCDQCAPAMGTCPICRSEIKGTMKTYLPSSN